MDGLNDPKVQALKARIENELHEPVLMDTPYCKIFRERHKGICYGCDSNKGCDNLVMMMEQEVLRMRKEQKRIKGELDGLL